MTKYTQASFEITNNTEAQAIARSFIDKKVSTAFSNTSLGSKLVSEYLDHTTNYFENLRSTKNRTPLWVRHLRALNRNQLLGVSAAVAVELVNGMTNQPKTRKIIDAALSAIGQTVGITIGELRNTPSYKTVPAEIIEYISKETKHFESQSVNNREHHIFLSEELEEKVRNMEEDYVMNTFCYYPTIEKPKRHYDLTSCEGGYHTFPSPLLKNPSDAAMEEYNKFTAETQPEFFASIWKAQETPYCTNTLVLDAIKKMIKDGYEHPDFPITRERHEGLFTKLHKEGQAKRWSTKMRLEQEKAKAKGATDEELKAMKVELSAYEMMEVKSNAEIQLRNMINKTSLTLRIAEDFAQYPEFFFPLFLDERSRRYTYCDAVFSYIGNSLSKPLIQFANKERLSAEGIENLYEALANSLGFDKLYRNDKIAKAKVWYEENRHAIQAEDYSIFHNTDMDDAYNALAASIELYKWNTDLSYESGFLFHLDARCSGMSILGTMLRDENVMYKTSVLPNFDDGTGKLPDCYGTLGSATRCMVESDEDKIAATELLAYDEIFGRSYFKKAMMTLGYGATLRTRNLEARKNLRDAGIDLSPTAAGLYNTAREVALKDQFPSCMNYLVATNTIAERYAKKYGFIKFSAPLTGFPCFTQKFISKKHQVKYTNAQGKISVLTVYKNGEKLDVSKMTTWTSPSYIHGSDAGILSVVSGTSPFPVATIHDSFASNCNNSNQLRKVYAFTMKRVFDEKPMDKFFAEMEHDMAGEDFIPVPYVNTINDGKGILDAQYIIC